MGPLRFVLFILAALGSVAQDVTMTNWTALTVLESTEIKLLCPATVSRWDLVQSSFIDYIIGDSIPSGKYGCRGVFEKIIGTGECNDGVSLDESLGSPLIISRISMGQAGLYMCNFATTTNNARSKAWNVTVVTNIPPLLTYEFNNSSLGLSNAFSRPSVSNGTVILFTCNTSYSGFHDPGLQIVLKYKDGVERLLNTSTSTDDIVFLSSATSRVSTTYKVKATDGMFDIVCRLSDGQFNSASTLRFQGPGSSLSVDTSTDLSQAAIIGIAIGVVAAVGLIITGVVLLVVFCRKRRRKKESSSYEDGVQSTNMPAIGRPSYSGARRPSMGLADVPSLYSQAHMRDSPVNSWLQASLSKADFYSNTQSWHGSGNLNGSFSGSTNAIPQTTTSQVIDETQEEEEDEYDIYEIVSNSSSLDDDLAESQQHLPPNEVHENRHS